MGEDMSDVDITRPLATETGFYPDGRAVAVHGTGHSTSTHIDASNRKNDWGPWVAVACILGGLAFGAAIIIAIMVPQLIEARMASITEIIDARAAEKAAPAMAKAEYAERESRVAIDQVQTARIELAKRGIFIQLDDHP